MEYDAMTYGDLMKVQTQQKTAKAAAVSKLDKPALLAKTGFLFGCDPEFFIKNDKGEHVSAEGLIPGTKEEPYKVDDGAVQVDGMAAEINIDPVDNFKDFDGKIVSVMVQLKRMLPKGHTIDIVPSVVFKPEVFEAAPEKAKELGCTPDFNAWTQDVNPPPSTESNPYLRCAGGHIHIGWTEGESIGDLQHLVNCCDLVKQLDWYLAGYSLRRDADAARRLLYGKAGACRIKPYGVEYRTLSNFWLKDKESRRQVWNRTIQAIEDMRDRFMPDFYPKNYSDLLIESINRSNPSTSLEQAAAFPLTTIEVPAAFARMATKRKMV